MRAHHVLLVSSTTALLAACTSPTAPLPKASPPEETPGPAYTTTTTATLTPSPGRTLRQIAAASAGDEGAIVYVESDAPDSQGIVQSSVVLQRLDATGAVSGSPVELDTVALNGDRSPALTVAADSGRYLACWERESTIACAGVPVHQGSAFPALSVNGAWPSLAHGSGTFALAYGAPEQVAVVRVANDGSAVGSPASFDTGDGTNPRAFLAATESGFALADGDDGGNSNVHVRRLDSDLAPIDSAIDLGVHLWFHAALAAQGTNVVIGLAKPYGGQVFTLDGGTVTHVHAFEAGGKEGMNVALLAGEASFDMLATYDGADSGLRHWTLQGDEVIASEQALLTDHSFDGSELAMLRLHGELFLIATDGLPSGGITVTRIHRQ